MRSAGPEPVKAGRDRILEAAYELFSRSGVRSVGVDTLIERAGVAKMTLYRNFDSKDALALAFLQQREDLWTRAWLQEEVIARASDPAGRLLAIFDVFGEWFQRDDFEGCAFITVMLQYAPDLDHPVRVASVQHLANIRDFLIAQAAAAGVADADAFARQWHILMKGSILAAQEGDSEAGARAQELGRLLLASHGIH
jgi:AcrR family transcriptional regulator